MISTVIGIIFSVLYNLLVSPLFAVIDLLQAIFQGFAGIGSIRAINNPISNKNNGEDDQTGVVFYLLRSSTVKNLFFALLTLAFVLLVLFTIIAFIKNMYAEKPKPWKDIITLSIKGLASFFVTPILCLFGVWAGNILLQTLFEATSDGNSRTMSAEVFIAGAYNANRMRLLSSFDITTYVNTLGEYHPNDPVVKKYTQGEPKKDPETGDIIRDPETNEPIMEEIPLSKLSSEEKKHLAELADNLFKGGGTMQASWGGTTTIALHDQSKITIFYESTQINYLMMIVGSIFMIYALGVITFGAVKRLFYLVFLFVLSPIFNAMYPIDDGNAAKGANKDFYKQTIGVYSSVVGLNVFYAILPLIMTLGWEDGLIGAAGNGLFSIILMICGLLTVKELIGLIDGYIGGSGLYNSGASLMSGVKGQLSKHGKKVGKVVGEFGKVHGARKAAMENGKDPNSAGAKVFFGDMKKGLYKTMGDWTGINPDAWKEDAKKGAKEGREGYYKGREKADFMEDYKQEHGNDDKAAKDAWRNREYDDAQKKYDKDRKKARKEIKTKMDAKDAANAIKFFNEDGFARSDVDTLMEEIETALKTINKASEDTQKDIKTGKGGLESKLKSLLDGLAKTGNAPVWYDKDDSFDEMISSYDMHQNVSTLNAKVKRADDAYTYRSNTDALSAYREKNHMAADASIADPGPEKEGESAAVTEQRRMFNIQTENATIAAKYDDKFKKEVQLGAESLRQLALAIGEQLDRALQATESKTNSNADFAEYADKISMSLKSTMEELKSKGSKDDDKQAALQQAMLQALKDLKTSSDAQLKEIKKLSEKNKKDSGGGAGK